MNLLNRFSDVTFNPFTDITWLNDSQKNALWINYLYNHSGEKEEAPLLEKNIFSVIPVNLSTLSHIINTMFLDKWNTLHDSLTLEYNPIDNYNRIEDTTTDITDSKTESTTSNNTDVMTGGHTNTLNDNNVNKRSAYDDDTYVDNESDTRNSTDTLVYDSETKTSNGENSSTSSGTGKNTVHSEVKGNIGVTTTQQMLTSEIELRRFNLINEMYNDLDTILTIGIYVY